MSQSTGPPPEVPRAVLHGAGCWGFALMAAHRGVQEGQSPPNPNLSGVAPSSLSPNLCSTRAWPHTGPSIHYWGLWSTASCLKEKGLSRLCFSSLKHIKRRRS